MTEIANPMDEKGNHAEGRPPQRTVWYTQVLFFVVLIAVWFWRSIAESGAHPEVDYSEFYSWLQNDNVASIVMKGDLVQGELRESVTVGDKKTQQFHVRIPAGDLTVLPLMHEKEVNIRIESEEQPFAIQFLMTLLPWVFIVGVWVWLSKRAQKMMGSGGPFAGIGKAKSRQFDASTAVNVTFDDVAGLKSAKQDLQEVVEFLKEPDKFQRLGAKVPRGILLVGPPGTGKTLMARAVAGESGVPFFSISASEFIEMFVGVGAARVRDLFSEAKKQAPAIVFIDEIDAVGRSRGAGLGGGHDEREQTLNQLLAEMDGFDRNDLTIVLAATNRPDVLDPALLRPGRFDRRVVVDRPEQEARREILAVHVRDMPVGQSADLQKIAEATVGFSGADLANLVNEAALNATRRGAESVADSDFSEAFDKIVLGDLRDGRLGEEEKKRVAVHEAGHATVAWFEPHAEALRRVSIIPRGMALGITMQASAEDRHILTRPQLDARLSVLMGGIAAEQEILQNVSTGAANDLKEATDIAVKMVAHYGMSETLGPTYYEHHVEHAFLGQRIATDSGTSDATIHTIEDEARKLLGAALERARELILEHRLSFDRLVEILMRDETVDGEPMRAALSADDSASKTNRT